MIVTNGGKMIPRFIEDNMGRTTHSGYLGLDQSISMLVLERTAFPLGDCYHVMLPDGDMCYVNVFDVEALS